MKIKSKSLSKFQKNIRRENSACIWEQLDNLTLFSHPEYNCKFNFMNEKKVLQLARIFNSKIKESKLKHIISIDSGSRPLINIMKRLNLNTGLKWKIIKCSRTFPANVANYILFYLSNSEKKANLTVKQKKSLEKKLRSLPKAKLNNLIRGKSISFILNLNIEELINLFSESFNTEKYRKTNVKLEKVVRFLKQPLKSCYWDMFNIILKESKLSKFTQKEFILFDEYVTSGTTLLSIHLLLSLFNKDVKYKLLTYYFNLDKKTKPGFPFFSEYYIDDIPNSYFKGIYPFENRIDIIGFFYLTTEEKIRFKRNTSLLSQTKTKKREVLDFILFLDRIVMENKILEKINSKIKYKPVKDYNTNAHAIRYLIFLLENDVLIKEFYLQYFEMYAPIWAPLPLDYHLNFVKAYDSNKDTLSNLIGKYSLTMKYKPIRKGLLNALVGKMNKNRLRYYDKIKKVSGEI